jgi:glycosyltransferase involved in cell wall biosynthesis
VKICIITPTYNRKTLLGKHLRRVLLQTYTDWRLVVVHDGPNESIRELMQPYLRDPRIEFLETKERGNDVGITPRLAGLEYILASKEVPDYCVFWDDDNLYALDALEHVSGALLKAGDPDLLLVAVGSGQRILPPADVPADALQEGQLDTACLVLRPILACNACAAVQAQKKSSPDRVRLINDYLTYEYVKDRIPKVKICRDLTVFVGRHDALRWGPYIRYIFGLKAMGLARRKWFRVLTFGMIQPR